MTMNPSERLKRLHDSAMVDAHTKRLRLRELRDWIMTGREIKERRRLEREAEKDLEDYNNGAASGDWTK